MKSTYAQRQRAWADRLDSRYEQRIRELESTNSDMLAAFDQFLRDEGYSDEDVGRILGPWISKAKETPR